MYTTLCVSVSLQRTNILFTVDGAWVPDVTTCAKTLPRYHALVGRAMLAKNTAATCESVTGPAQTVSPGGISVEARVSTAHAITSDPAETESTCTRLTLTFSAAATSNSTWATKTVLVSADPMTDTGSAKAKRKVTAETDDGSGVGAGVVLGTTDGATLPVAEADTLTLTLLPPLKPLADGDNALAVRLCAVADDGAVEVADVPTADAETDRDVNDTDDGDEPPVEVAVTVAKAEAEPVAEDEDGEEEPVGVNCE
jgi:hypothetical protein